MYNKIICFIALLFHMTKIANWLLEFLKNETKTFSVL